MQIVLRRSRSLGIAVLTGLAVSSVVARPVGAHPASYACAVDCNLNDEVTIGELQTGVNILLGLQSVLTCPAADPNGDGIVTIAEVTKGVRFALEGCPIPPDLTIDVSDFDDWLHVFVNMPAGYPDFRVLRVGTGTPNISVAPLQIEGVQGVPGVSQRVFNSTGVSQTVAVEGDLTFHPEHGHIHYDTWVDLRIVDDAPGCLNPNTRPSGCILAEHAKVSFCLLDSAVFDAGLAGPQTYGGCGLVQGVSSGWKDVYPQGTPGQFILLDDIGLGLPTSDIGPGSYYIEAHVDPEDRLVEAPSTNNIGQSAITLPVAFDDVHDCSATAEDCCAGTEGLPPPSVIRCALCKQYFCFLNPESVACDGNCATCSPAPTFCVGF